MLFKVRSRATHTNVKANEADKAKKSTNEPKKEPTSLVQNMVQ